MPWAEVGLGCIRMGKQTGLRAGQSPKTGRARSYSIKEHLNTSSALEPEPSSRTVVLAVTRGRLKCPGVIEIDDRIRTDWIQLDPSHGTAVVGGGLMPEVSADLPNLAAYISYSYGPI
jgi:hypothetical protein